MRQLCLYFHVHQPRRLRQVRYFDIGHQQDSYDDVKNAAILRRVSEKCYLPANRILLDLIHQFDGQFRVAFSITGTVIEQLKWFHPQALESFRALVATGCVEILGETTNHSLSSIFSRENFTNEVKIHQQIIQEEFGVTPQVFRNTELIYNNATAEMVHDLGFKGILAEGFHTLLNGKSPNHVYHAAPCPDLKMLLRHYSLSDDIAFRFSNGLTATQYAQWLCHITDAQTINLFLDYETFGEHHWHESGILNFLAHLPQELNGQFEFATPSQIIANIPSIAGLDVPNLTSWADTERDVSAWIGNDLQLDAIESIYRLGPAVIASQNQNLIDTWQRFLTSDHFYYMCLKWHADGDVHQYFNPYGNPYEAYLNYQNAVKNFALQL